MAKKHWLVVLATGLAGASGCITGPESGNPIRVRPGMTQFAMENPIFVPQGYEGYALVFDRTYDVVTEYFDVSYSNRFDGRIETWPLLTAGYFEPGRLLPSAYENLEATFQTIRRRAIVLITPADSGGYYIEVQVLKELEDLAQPTFAGKGAASIHPTISSERRFEAVVPEICSNGWIPIGRDHALEQEILARLRKCL